MNKIKLNSISLNGNSLNAGRGIDSGGEYNESVMTFDIITTDAPTRIFGANFNLSQIEKIWVDGVEITPSAEHQFNSLGIHIVKVRFNNLKSTRMMFRMAYQMVRLNFARFDTSQVEDFAFTFSDTTNLKGIFDNSFDISKGVGFNYMFANSGFNKIILSKGNITGSLIVDNMFYYCPSLVTLDLSAFIFKDVKPLNLISLSNNLQNFIPFRHWNSGDFILDASKLTPYSIHLIIERASELNEFAEQRTLTLHADAKANWMASEYYDADVVMANEKLITIA